MNIKNSNYLDDHKSKTYTSEYHHLMCKVDNREKQYIKYNFNVTTTTLQIINVTKSMHQVINVTIIESVRRDFTLAVSEIKRDAAEFRR